MIQHVIDVEETCRIIRHLCKEKGYSAAELQAALNLSSIQAVYKWFSGRSIPSIDNLVLIAGLFDKPLNEILKTKVIDDNLSKINEKHYK